MRGPVGSLAAPDKPGEYEALDTGVAGVAVYLHRDLAVGGSEVQFEFGLLGRCRVLLQQPTSILKEATMGEPSVGFVGGGRVARILLAGWKRAHCCASGVVVSDTDTGVLDRLRTQFPAVSTTDDNLRAAGQDLVFLALHPPAFPTVLPQVKDSLSTHAVLISLAPKWTMSRICGLLGGFNRLARVIPNAPSIVNAGYNPVSFGESVPAAGRERVLALLAPLGACPEVPENTLEAYAIVAAMGPTYLWYQLYQLIELGCQFGLSRQAATDAVAAMVHGAARTMTDSGLPPQAVTDLIPVKPLAAIEQTVKEAYASTLEALHAKLKA